MTPQPTYENTLSDELARVKADLEETTGAAHLWEQTASRRMDAILELERERNELKEPLLRFVPLFAILKSCCAYHCRKCR